MPYSGIDDPATIAKIDSCVEKVMAEGHDKESAIAICRASVGKEAQAMSEETENKSSNPFSDSPYLKLIGEMLDELKTAVKEFIETTKAGARHSKPDRDKLQSIHDFASDLGAECMGKMSVVKQADGKLRWVMFSSTSFQDRDGEIISQKALAEDVARMDASGDYGPLDWWHIPGLNLGQCDFNAMDGKVLIESGTFISPEVGAAIQEKSNQLGGSIAFYHPATEPDAGGVYKNIRRFARAVLPQTEASNLFTRLTVKEHEAMDIEPRKLEALKALVGDALAQDLIAQSDAVQKAAEAAGVKFKEAPKEEAAPEKKPRTMADYTEDEMKAFIQKCMTDMGAKKEADTHAEATKALQYEIVKVKNLQGLANKRVTDLEKQLAELNGEQPRANTQTTGYRPTQDKGNVRQAETQKAANGQPVGPQVDPGFMQFLSGQGRSDPSAVA